MKLGSLLVDVSPLRENRDYRWLYLGRTASLMGTAFTEVAINWQIYAITHSVLDVGIGSLIGSVLTVAGLLYGGDLADRLDRRTVLQVLRVPQALLVGALAVLSFADRHPALWILFLFTAAMGLLGGLAAPSSSASVPRIVGKERMAAAAALNGLSYQGGAIVGPALAGLLIAGPGLTWCYVIDAVTYLVFTVCVSFLPPMPPGGDAPRKTGIPAIREGLAYVRRNGVLVGVLVVDANAMIFGLPEALFPALAIHHFHGTSVTFGLLTTGPAIGAVIGAMCSGWTGKVRRPGVVVLCATGIWGAAMIVFGITDLLVVGMAMLALAGIADVFSEVLRSALLQAYTPDHVRGRVTALWLAQTNAAPGLGNAEAGAVAGLFGPVASVISGGALCILGAAALAGLCPRLRTATQDPEEADLARAATPARGRDRGRPPVAAAPS